MKFLILALCVCAASAAVFKPYQPFVFKPEAREVPVFPAVKTVTVKPVYKKPEVPIPVVPVVPAPKSVSSVVESEAPIVRFKNSFEPESQSFNYAYETGNGIAAESSGTLKRVGDIDVLAVQGSYQYYSPEGVPVQVSYVADENGFQPRSDLLPQAPEIPEAILRSLEYIASHPKYVEQKKL